VQVYPQALRFILIKLRWPSDALRRPPASAAAPDMRGVASYE
jgi:hypothetical protein